MRIEGFEPSYNHVENGMTREDMFACLRVAAQLDEVIIFRSTGPWSQRWIERGYPTKNFHVKGKSSDWGPQAGFVPYLGIYSKVGASPEKAAKGTAANVKGLAHNHAGKVPLVLSLEELTIQLNREAESPARRAISRMTPVPDSKDFFLFANRSGDGKEFVFRATFIGGANYKISVYPERLGVNPKKLMFEKSEPLEVMTSVEVGAGNKPMTGDYDLMAICPKWGNLNSKSVKEISKPGLDFGKAHGGVQPGLTFAPGTNLDKVLDMSTNTGAVAAKGNLSRTFQGKNAGEAGKNEHPDMGNLTPRILRCINALNSAMPGASALRRVHHNAESHRNHIFAALTHTEMMNGEGFPLTAFHPNGGVTTILDLPEFNLFAKELHAAGYFVPRNWVWGMSIRDGFHKKSS